MLRFRLRGDEPLLVWKASISGWVAGESFIEPFRHPALEDFAVAGNDRLLIVVRERLSGVSSSSSAGASGLCRAADGLAAELSAAKRWPLQYVILLLSQDPSEPRITIYSGAWGKAPIYLLSRADGLRGEWDPAALYPFLPHRTLNPELAAHYLVAFSCPYSRTTLFPGMQMLTERSWARWGKGASGLPELRIEYPADVPPPRPRALKPGTDVLAMFRRILFASMRRWPEVSSAVVGSELSGGLDSAVVSTVASALVPESIRTYGIILLDDAGQEQQRRRQPLIDRFGFADNTVDGRGYLPFTEPSRRLREHRVVPWEECYYEAVDRLLEIAYQDGTRVLLTGFGGDELLQPHGHEHSGADRATPRPSLPPFLSERARQAYFDTLTTLDDAPRSIIPTSALEAVSDTSPLYLARGVWPIHPLTTPELVRFCRRLPREWRQDRMLERRLLTRLGCPREVAFPRGTDDFTPLLVRGLRQSARPTLDGLFADSYLADLGFVDGEILRSSFADYCRRPQPDSWCTFFYAAAALELTLRCVGIRQEGGVESRHRAPASGNERELLGEIKKG